MCWQIYPIVYPKLDETAHVTIIGSPLQQNELDEVNSVIGYYVERFPRVEGETPNMNNMQVSLVFTTSHGQQNKYFNLLVRERRFIDRRRLKKSNVSIAWWPAE